MLVSAAIKAASAVRYSLCLDPAGHRLAMLGSPTGLPERSPGSRRAHACGRNDGLARPAAKGEDTGPEWPLTQEGGHTGICSAFAGAGERFREAHARPVGGMDAAAVAGTPARALTQSQAAGAV